jgi:hypothetical protein
MQWRETWQFDTLQNGLAVSRTFDRPDSSRLTEHY